MQRERAEIEILRVRGYSLRQIARVLGRAVSTLSDEVRRNKVRGMYLAHKAQHKASVRRKYSKYQGMKIVEDPWLRSTVDGLLWDDQSPRAVAGRLGSISPASIWRYLRSPYGRRLETHRARFQKRRYQNRGRNIVFANRIFLHDRPAHIQGRMRVGHAEGDFIVSGRSGSGLLLVVVDRKHRRVCLEKITRPSCAAVQQAFLKIQQRYCEWRSVTLDNDILFQKHTELARVLGIRIYFCHPYHAWEKGSVENVNKQIRRYLPKGSNISRYAKRFFHDLEAKLNRRILGVLGYRTPDEVRHIYLKQKERRVAQRQTKKPRCSD